MADLCMTAEHFQAYLDAFNRDDYASFSSYYADDVVLVLGGKREIHGRQAIVDFYKPVKAKTRREIVANRVVIGVDGIAAELESTFLALEDIPDLLARPLKKGEGDDIAQIVFALWTAFQ